MTEHVTEPISAEPPGVAESAPAHPPGLIESILGDFRSWLEQQPDLAAVPATEPRAELDWAALVGQFTALRHEVNLQTKATRQQQEQGAQAIEQTRLALEALKQQQAAALQNEKQAQDEALRPLLKTLVDVHDALSLARREVLRLADIEAGDWLIDDSYDPPTGSDDEDDWEPPPPVSIQMPFLARLFGGKAAVDRALEPLIAWHADLQRRLEQSPPPPAEDEIDEDEEDDEPPPSLLRSKVDALLVGYDMSLQRLDRALLLHGLEPIPCVGEPFDPELMEVAEVVRDPGRQDTAVLDEVRRGYRWRGRLFRYAQVRVVRPA